MGTAIKHPAPDRVKPSFVIFDTRVSDAQLRVSECPGVKNYERRLNPVWHRMLYSYYSSTGRQRVKVSYNSDDWRWWWCDVCQPCPVPPRIDNDRQLQLKATLGSEVDLPCRTSGVPPPRVVWQKGTRILADLPGTSYVRARSSQS